MLRSQAYCNDGACRRSVRYGARLARRITNKCREAVYPSFLFHSYSDPFPWGLVVKNGSKTRNLRLGRPCRIPVSATRQASRSRPGQYDLRAVPYASSSRTAFAGRDGRARPPLRHGVAGVDRQVHAAPARSGPGSTWTRPRGAGSVGVDAQCPRRSAAGASAQSLPDHHARSITIGWSTCLRLKARSCPVRAAARCAGGLDQPEHPVAAASLGRQVGQDKLARGR